ncbi:polyisoprenyl-teichoic acid--peptidoglycan teichoic acid transferase TagU [Pueribacillus theae]|uniref:polyisoprenyl-teichoic acid--peptidoglycan teichoic acid transferase TagU n=1 Tax=Pueribacillus theae TaxID=2171751 RepID=UPI001057B00F|nr:LytR family transcriptional regulator [Pueribacillus theae]
MKKALIILGTIAGVIALAFGGYAFYLYKSITDTASHIHEPIDRGSSDKRAEQINTSSQDPISFLLLGVDERPGDRGRSDTMVVITVNPKKESMIMFSIPRDTRTEIIGRGSEDKINHAYAFGGSQMSVETVENFLDIPIDYYVKVNMEAFKEIVDAVGGVTVDNKLAFKSGGYQFSEGSVDLDGDAALAYSRMRKGDPKGDLGRNERQQQIIKAIIKKGASPKMITKFNDVLGTLETNVKTNLTFDEMKAIQKNYRAALGNTEQFEVKGSGTKINGIYYYIVSDEEKNEITAKLKEHLEID